MGLLRNSVYAVILRPKPACRPSASPRGEQAGISTLIISFASVRMTENGISQQSHHRKSNDLDFFTGIEEVMLPFSYELGKILQTEGTSLKRQRAAHSFVEFLTTIKAKSRSAVHLV